MLLSAASLGATALAPPLSWGRDLMLRCLPGAQIMARLDWLYGWQPGG